MNETDYEQLYHLMNRRRGEELRQMEAFREAYDALLDAFIETDRQLADCAERQSEPVLEAISSHYKLLDSVDRQIDAFLFRLDHRFHLKRVAAARAAMQILAMDEEKISSMGILYEKVAEVIGVTKYGAERNLRSYRKAVAEANTDFYRLSLAQHNTNNADFYWNALRLFKQEMRQPTP
ncbi:hypothetical protein LJC63_05840 [Ruminococcaceae bacterium OttesenSCG-928-L11]|nr:hypothetical protein [Ruminococcaceae bacterium OttesenSCG-928-L11]